MKYKEVNNGLCIRYPNEVAKLSDDTCGEWKQNNHYVPQLLTEDAE